MPRAAEIAAAKWAGVDTGERPALKDEMSRFSDEELRVLRSDVDRLADSYKNLSDRQERFETVVFAAHSQQEEQSRQSDMADRKETHKWMETFAIEVAAARKDVAKVKADTAEIIQLHRDAKGALRVGAAVGSFLKWLGGFAIIGGLITWAYSTFGIKP